MDWKKFTAQNVFFPVISIDNIELYFIQDVSPTEGGSEPIFDLSDAGPTGDVASPIKGAQNTPTHSITLPVPI